jgi:hypothetical protein
VPSVRPNENSRLGIRTWLAASVRTASHFWKQQRSGWWLQNAVTLPTRSFFSIPNGAHEFLLRARLNLQPIRRSLSRSVSVGRTHPSWLYHGAGSAGHSNSIQVHRQVTEKRVFRTTRGYGCGRMPQERLERGVRYREPSAQAAPRYRCERKLRTCRKASLRQEKSFDQLYQSAEAMNCF